MPELGLEGAPIGNLYPTRMPNVSQVADIRTALQLMFYGNSTDGPTLTAGQEADIPSTSIAGRLRDLTNTKLNINNPTTTGKLTTAASAAGSAGFNLPPGTAPTLPANGDMWTTTSGLSARINGVTQTFIPDTVNALNYLKSIDNETMAHTLQIGYGVNPSGQSKVIRIGDGGASGSTTSIYLGSTNGTTITLNGAVSAPTSLASPAITASTTLTLGAGSVIMRSGSGVPSTSDANGSLYLRTDNTYDTMLYARTGGNWRPVRSTKWFSGNTSPSAGIGEQPGDYFINTVTGEIWLAS